MINDYAKNTTYRDVEDLKRLDFIVNSIKSLNNPNAKVLDIGCGNGNMSLALGSLGYAVTGIDIDQLSIDHAAALNTFANVKFEVNDANSLPVIDEFDAVVCSEVLEHLIQPGKLLQTIYRILKPGGVFVATVPNGYGPREVLITRPMQWLHKKGWDKPVITFKKLLGYNAITMQSSSEDLQHIHFFQLHTFNKLMNDHHFVNIEFKNADFIERIFPFSLLTRRIKLLQMLDCHIADFLPRQLTSGFYTSWTKAAK